MVHHGGTANVTVIVSDERISSHSQQVDVAIVLNQPSLDVRTKG